MGSVTRARPSGSCDITFLDGELRSRCSLSDMIGGYAVDYVPRRRTFLVLARGQPLTVVADADDRLCTNAEAMVKAVFDAIPPSADEQRRRSFKELLRVDIQQMLDGMRVRNNSNIDHWDAGLLWSKPRLSCLVPSRTSSISVWEHLTDDGDWHALNPDYSEFLDSLSATGIGRHQEPGGGWVQIKLCEKFDKVLCGFRGMHGSFNPSQQMRRTVVDPEFGLWGLATSGFPASSRPPLTLVQWQHRSNKSHWMPFKDEASVELENAFRCGHAAHVLQPKPVEGVTDPYIVHFRSWTQYNATNGNVRWVRRMIQADWTCPCGRINAAADSHCQCNAVPTYSTQMVVGALSVGARPLHVAVSSPSAKLEAATLFFMLHVKGKAMKDCGLEMDEPPPVHSRYAVRLQEYGLTAFVPHDGRLVPLPPMIRRRDPLYDVIAKEVPLPRIRSDGDGDGTDNYFLDQVRYVWGLCFSRYGPDEPFVEV